MRPPIVRKWRSSIVWAAVTVCQRLIYGFIATGDPAQAVEYGAAHGALAMTTPGDTSMATKGEVERLMGGGGARVQR